MKNPIKTFSPNLHGSDYVIGDLHGSYSAFENLCKNLNFNPDRDRMFSVGDLIDRGPDSLKCLSLLRQPWFESVLANHEKMMIDKFNNEWGGMYWFNNGGVWGMSAVNSYKNPKITPSDEDFELHDLLETVKELPFLITINTKSGKKFHILHAELPSGFINITDEYLSDPVKLMNLARVVRNQGDAFLWARNIFETFHERNFDKRTEIIEDIYYDGNYDVFNDKLSHIISGHTILRQPMTIVGQTNIDTGAYRSYYYPSNVYGKMPETPPDWAALTCVELDSWSFYQATETQFRTVNPFVVSKEDIDNFKDSKT